MNGGKPHRMDKKLNNDDGRQLWEDNQLLDR